MLDTDPYIRMMFGCHAVRVPIQMAVQQASEHTLVTVTLTRAMPGDLRFGSDKAHQLVLGDAVIRPHVVLETDAFKGHGLGGLAMEPVEEWVRQGNVLLNPAGRELP
jgi:hypothetical protein